MKRAVSFLQKYMDIIICNLDLLNTVALQRKHIYTLATFVDQNHSFCLLADAEEPVFVTTKYFFRSVHRQCPIRFLLI